MVAKFAPGKEQMLNTVMVKCRSPIRTNMRLDVCEEYQRSNE